MVRFTVLTPTFNRAHTLGGVYESLCGQTFKDFEWVIIDDGSTDGTRELVSSWKSFFRIRFFWHPNRGKHTAMNLGVSVAEGEFVLFFDSDDRCVPTALERFDYHWRQIADPLRFANVSCLCRRPDGSVIGRPFPTAYVDAFRFADQLRYRSGAERWGINRTDVLREFPFPEGERFVPEGLIWNRISRKYATRFINEALRIFEYSSGGLTASITKQRMESPKATILYYRELLLSPAPIFVRMKAGLNYCRFSALESHRKITRLLREPVKSH